MYLSDGMDFSDIFNALTRDPWKDKGKALEKFVAHYLDSDNRENEDVKREST